MTFPGLGRTDITDATDKSLITDFTQVVSCAVGKNRVERRRQKIRRELAQQYFGNDQQAALSLLARVRKLFGYR